MLKHVGAMYKTVGINYRIMHSATALSGPGPPHYQSSQSHSRATFSNPSQRPLPDNRQHSQETDIHDPKGIQTHNPSKQQPQALSLDHAATGIGQLQ